MKKLLLVPFMCALVACTNSVSHSSNIDPSSNSNIEPSSNSGILIAYFSATGHTKVLAEYARKHFSSDIFEIEPAIPYTDEDLNYSNDNSRANKEQNDDAARPDIKNRIEDISKYKTLVLGYPIWWGQAPKIMYSFIESYDLKDMTILPFCTSGSSDIGSSATNLAKSASDAHWLNGKRFPASTSEETFTSWLDENIKAKESDEEGMKLSIDNRNVDVTWEDNDSVKALTQLAKNTLTINMHEYGGFEQTGSIGSSIVRNDSRINTEPGDVVLYNGNAISVFYEPSSWSYTRLGHINMNKNELNALLNKDAVVFVLEVK